VHITHCHLFSILHCTIDWLGSSFLLLLLACCGTLADMTPSHELQSNNAPSESSFVHIEAWADEAVQAITTLRLHTPTPDTIPPTRGTATKLEIPLDVRISDGQVGDTRCNTYVPRRPLSRRDSMKRRDALLMGKEGSRRRQRWENS
jgi:hypothetical protein